MKQGALYQKARTSWKPELVQPVRVFAFVSYGKPMRQVPLAQLLQHTNAVSANILLSIG